MLNLQAKWWMFTVRGILAILFGILAFFRPDITLISLVGLFGMYALFDGVLHIASAFSVTGTTSFWWMLLDGVLGIAAGIVTLVVPGVTAISLVFLLGGWLIVGGVFRIVVAAEFGKAFGYTWLYVVGGLISVVAGTLTFFSPIQSAFSWLWVMGIYAFFYGVSLIALGFGARSGASNASVGGSAFQG
jgi:uncharacterized membrane protein HdeD (DUF308 family)